MLFKLNSELIKNNILSKRSYLRGTNIFINVDLHKQTLNKQLQCKPLIKVLKSNGIATKMVNDNIKINDKFYKLDEI